MKKTELFYFSKNDLMISVVYNKKEAMASYTCHRKMASRETVLIEKYIEIKVLESPHPIIAYFGEDDELQKTWNEFHSIDRDKTWKPSTLQYSYNICRNVEEPPNKEDLIKKIHDKYSDKKELLANLQSFLLDGINTKKIEELKKNADEGFCFDRIGDILRDRNENHPDEPMYLMRELVFYLKEYNTLTNDNIHIDSLLT